MAVSDPMGHHPAKDLRTRTDCRQRRTGKALNKQKLALKSVNFGLIYIDKNYLVQWEETTQIASLVKGRHYTPGQICYKTSALRDTPCEQCAFQKAIEQGKSYAILSR